MFKHDINRSSYSDVPIPDTPVPTWKFKLSDNAIASPIVANNSIYISTVSGDVYRIDKNGTKIWNTPLGTGINSSAVFYNRTIFLGGENGSLYALNENNGSVIWNVSFNSSIRSSPLVYNEKIFFGTMDGKVYAVYATNGSEIWNFSTSGGIYSSIAIAYDLLFFGSENAHFYAIWESNGTEAWNYSTEGKIRSTCAIANDNVYFGSYDNFLYALKAKTGTKVWQAVLGGEIESSPAIYKNVIYIGSNDSYLYAINEQNGAKLWKFKTDGIISTSPSIGKYKVVLSSLNHLHSIDLNGSEEWNYTFSANISSPSIAYGYIYVAGMDGFLYAFGNYAPFAFAGNDKFVNPKEIVRFEGVGYDLFAGEKIEGGIKLYEWDFDGDGIYDMKNNIDGNAMHIYENSGKYNATFRVTDLNDVTKTDACVVTVNSPPTKPKLSIIPKDPKTTDDLIAIAEGSIDIDGQNVDYIYEWFKNDVKQGITGNIVNATFTKKDEKWKCVVKPTDGKLTGEAETASVTILNTPPIVTNLSISPEIAYRDSVFEMNVISSYDADGENISYYFKWYVMKVLVGYNRTFTYGFTKGDAVYGTVTPYDGQEYGVPTQTKTIVIKNSPPKKPKIKILPEEPTKLSELECIILEESKDIDDDAVNYRYAWYKNGKHIKELVFKVPSSYLEKNDLWKCIVTPNDGTDDGEQSEANITISNAPPKAFAGLDMVVGLRENITLNGSGIDTDGIILIYEWDFDGDGIIDLTSKRGDVNYSYNAPGIYKAILTVTDDNGAKANSSVRITVINKEPKAIANAKDTIVLGEICYFDANASFDPDGTITNYTWDFGDGSFGYGKNVSHNYTVAAVYMVKLIVTDDFGKNSTDAIQIIVTPSEEVKQKKKEDFLAKLLSDPIFIGVLFLILAAVACGGSYFFLFWKPPKKIEKIEVPREEKIEEKPKEEKPKTEDIKSIYVKDEIAGYEKYIEEKEKFEKELEELKSKILIPTYREEEKVEEGLPERGEALEGITVKKRKVPIGIEGETPIIEIKEALEGLDERCKTALEITNKVFMRLPSLKPENRTVIQDKILDIMREVKDKKYENALKYAMECERLVDEAEKAVREKEEAVKKEEEIARGAIESVKKLLLKVESEQAEKLLRLAESALGRGYIDGAVKYAEKAKKILEEAVIEKPIEKPSEKPSIEERIKNAGNLIENMKRKGEDTEGIESMIRLAKTFFRAKRYERAEAILDKIEKGEYGKER
ncbi:MAG: PQQ-binding-like beta-propeller repeat protein [Candidatus Thermoplasmatota archaeon]